MGDCDDPFMICKFGFMLMDCMYSFFYFFCLITITNQEKKV